MNIFKYGYFSDLIHDLGFVFVLIVMAFSYMQ